MNSQQVASWFISIEHLLNWRIGGIQVAPLIVAAVVTGLAFVALMVTRAMLSRYLGAWAVYTQSDLDDLLVKLINATRKIVLLIIALYAGSLALHLAQHGREIAGAAAAIAVLVQFGLWGNQTITYVLARLMKLHAHEDGGLANAAGALNFLSRVALWSIVALLILASLQINVTALVAGLGVGGIAIALAVQSILSDLFASLSIVLDKPFAIGHFIVVDDLSGTVEHVGIKSTRLRSLSGEEIVLSNGDLLKSRIHNYKKLFERRVLFGFGVTYDTPGQKLAAIPAMVRKIIEEVSKTRFDRAHFKEFGDSSLNFEVVYFVLDADYNLYMDIQQRINLGMIDRFGEEGIEFAFPTRTLYVAASNGAAEKDRPANSRPADQRPASQ